jgi:E3 ubiquitin-protein ligase RNF14
MDGTYGESFYRGPVKADRIQSIYPECTAGSEGPKNSTTEPSLIRLEIPIEMEERIFELLPQTTEISSRNDLQLALTHLPPLIITLVLPLEYPLREIPMIRHIHSTYGWLVPEKFEEFRHMLTDIWKEDLASNSGTLWRTCEWIRSGSFLKRNEILCVFMI